MRKHFLKVSLLSVVFSVLFVLSASASSMGGGTVTASALNICTAADDDASVLTTAPHDAALIVTGQSNGWYGVCYHGYAGYVRADCLKYTGKLDGQFGIGTVSANGVRIRSGPGLTSNVITYCSTGDRLTVTGIDGPWYRILSGELEGYIHSSYLTMTMPVQADFAEADNSLFNGNCAIQPDAGDTAEIPCAAGEYNVSGAQIVQTAMQYLGVPYVWGGTSPNGFDCSGLVYYVYQQNGYAVNRTAESLYSNGVYVDRSNLQLGDVICFYSSPGDSYIGHTGIYIGNGKMVHASSSQNAIAVADLSMDYFSARYCGARRIVS